MTDDDPEQAAQQMCAIAAALTAAGMHTQVYQTRGALDVTASLCRPGGKAIGLTVEEAHFVQLCWQNPVDGTAGQVVATIGRVLAAIAEPS